MVLLVPNRTQGPSLYVKHNSYQMEPYRSRGSVGGKNQTMTQAILDHARLKKCVCALDDLHIIMFAEQYSCFITYVETGTEECSWRSAPSRRPTQVN